MKRLLLGTALMMAGCYTDSSDTPDPSSASQLSTFQVKVKKLSAVASNGALTPLSVTTSCIYRYGVSTDAVPAEVRGTPECRYAIPKNPVDIELEITALDAASQPLTSFNGPVSFRAVPGDLSGGYATRWTTLTNGTGTGTVRVSHLYGDVRVWVQDEPPQVDFLDGGVSGDPSQLPPDSGTPPTFATGITPAILFEEPTISRMQEPDLQTNNRGSPFDRQFLTVGRAPENGAPLVQNCPLGYNLQDPNAKDPNHGKLVTMVVTGLDPGGFFVTDITACRVREYTGTGSNVRTPEEDGFTPGTYGSVYVYNYSFPEGLYPGDLLWSLSGSVQDFTATTQLTFPSWIIRERVRDTLPPAQWTKYLDQVQVRELALRYCGLDNKPEVYNTDPLCGYSYGNMKMESMESSLVKVRRVRFPQVFKTCDANGDGAVTFFCPGSGNGAWTTCADVEPPEEAIERKCNAECVTGTGEFAGQICSERTTLNSYGQFVVEMANPGPREAGRDNSLSGRTQVLKVSAQSTATTTALNSTVANGPARVNVWCDTPVKVKFGARTVAATAGDTALAARTNLAHTMASTEQYVAVIADGAISGRGECHVSLDSRTRINIMTRDAIPELRVDCNESDADAGKARQCRLLRAATYNITGHLKQVNAARPRWVINPRDADDLCCFPGPEGECPSPIKTCPDENAVP
ncbi:hypothetical protein SAMN05444354_110111 [Stigmatella aurantiaca]|uniref:Lipoprotein n=1 Tax=Stigmatella aurantiaca TaxID=41 RepID=A0A1H7UNZ3_STIAU|nr:hypothetical protein [Stigmatella aurantiaca]SEL98087.1 hypothetical protein SAMN05444354_110111 [Stigmatella aurantiaca]